MSGLACARRASALLAAVVATVGCTSPSSDVVLVFATEAARARVDTIAFTAVEPFLLRGDGAAGARLLRCGQLTVFPPVAAGGVSRDVTDLAPLRTLRGANRTPRAFPFSEPWDLGLDRFALDEASNPTRAVLLHFEGRGPARRGEPVLSDADEDRTLLEGCTCVRLREQGSTGDAALDAELDAACPWTGAPGLSTRTVRMGSVAPPEFRLEPCAVTELTAPSGRHVTLAPGVCLRATRCEPDNPTPGCFPCATSRCSELSDRKNVAVSVTIEPPIDGVRVVAPVIVTGSAGSVTPELVVERCTPGQLIPVQVALLGRAEPPIELRVRCVAPVDFDAQPSAEVELGTGGAANTVVDITALPAVPARGASPAERAKIAVLLVESDAPPRTRLEVWGVPEGASTLVRLATRSAIPGRALGVYGYAYARPTDGAAPSVPLLAVATATSVAGRPRASTPLLQLFRPITRGDTLELEPVADMVGLCARTACGGRQGDACEASPCSAEPPLDYTSVARATFASADQDGDGFAELYVGSDRLLPLTVYGSRGPGPGGEVQLPTALARHCQCQALGRALPAFAIGQLGGPGDALGGSGLDVVAGDASGAYVRYGARAALEGRPCADGSTCPAGQVCADVACGPETRGGVTLRCLAPCAAGDRGACGGRSERCVLAADGLRYCATDGLGCAGGSAFMTLTAVHDVGVARLSGGAVDAVVAVAGGTATAGAAGATEVRLFFGGDGDLARLAQPSAVDREASVPLTPRRLRRSTADPTRGDEPQGPRAVRFGDFNRDGAEDVAVLYTTTEELRVWLGSASKAPGELGERLDGAGEGGRIKLNRCPGACTQRERCFPFARFAVGDVDGDGAADAAVICNPQGAMRPRLALYTPVSR